MTARWVAPADDRPPGHRRGLREPLHVTPGPKAIGERVVKGEPIASVRTHPAGDHLHFEPWHWITTPPRGGPDAAAVPVDPTRLLYHWEQALTLDYAALGSIDAAASADLDAESPGATLVAAYRDSGIRVHQAPEADRILVELLRSAFAARSHVELEVRRSVYWRMDGSLDEVAGLVCGVRVA